MAKEGEVIDRIEKGDIVRVDFNNSQYTLSSRAVVLFLPVVTGDSWIIKDKETGTVFHISEGCTIALLEKEANDGEV